MNWTRWRMLAALTASVVALCCGCGYRVMPGGDVPAELESVYVVMFVNRTLEPSLEKQLTDRLIVELQRSGRYEISEDREAADLLLEGEVLSYATDPKAYDRDDAVLLYQSSLSARAVLRLRSSGRVVWRGESGWRETFPRFDDKALQRDAERTASRELVGRVAEELYARLAERF